MVCKVTVLHGSVTVTTPLPFSLLKLIMMSGSLTTVLQTSAAEVILTGQNLMLIFGTLALPKSVNMIYPLLWITSLTKLSPTSYPILVTPWEQQPCLLQ